MKFVLQNFSMSNLILRNCEPVAQDVTAYEEKNINEALNLLFLENPKRKNRWSVNNVGDIQMLNGKFYFKNYEETFEFVTAVYDIALQQGYYPDITFGDGFVYISLFTVRLKGVHDNDFIMLAKIEDLLND